jgi:hypothetical protein
MTSSMAASATGSSLRRGPSHYFTVKGLHYEIMAG